jgi:glyoxylase-like metal-dependent hydrolase (beta-lactamase superfamily II)
LTREQANGAYVVNGSNVAAVDVPSIEAAFEMMDEAKILFSHPIKYIILTHADYDHVNGLPAFLDQPVTIFCSQRILNQENLKSNPAISQRNVFKSQNLPYKADLENRQYNATFVGVQGNMHFYLSGLDIELFTLQGTAHSPWDMFVRLPQDQCLCTGDVAIATDYLYFANANIDNWIKCLKILSLEKGLYILPGHGDIYPYEKLTEVAEYIDFIRKTSKRCLSELPEGQLKEMNDEKIDAIVSSYLSSPDPDSLVIKQKSGTQAQIHLHMVIRYLLDQSY